MQITTYSPAQRSGKVKKKLRFILPVLGAFFLLAGLCTLLPVQKSYAATRATPCLTAPETQKAQDCDGNDPILEQCVTDAHTTDHVFITDGKRVIGRLELRFSRACGTYWGRVFSFLPQVFLSIHVRDLASFPANVRSFSGRFVEIYSNMFWFNQPTIDTQPGACAQRSGRSAIYLARY